MLSDLLYAPQCLIPEPAMMGLVRITTRFGFDFVAWLERAKPVGCSHYFLQLDLHLKIPRLEQLTH